MFAVVVFTRVKETLNPFSTNVPLLYRGYGSGTLVENGLKKKLAFSSCGKYLPSAEAAVRWCFIKKLFWKISQYSQEHTCVGVSF